MARLDSIPVLLLPVLITLFLFAPALAAETNLTTVRFAVSGRTASDWPLLVGKEKKLFQKNGVYLEDIVIPGGPNMVRAVISNTVPMGRINPDRTIEAAERGAKVKIISGDMQKIPYDLMARPEIKSGAELRGKLIGVDSLTGGTTFMLQEVAQKAYGLSDKDYKLLVVWTSPERYAALKGGSVQATFMVPPFNLRARKDGFTKLTTFHEHLGPVQFVATFAHADYIKSNRGDVVKLVKAMIESTRWLYEVNNKEEALAIYIKYLKATRDAAETDYRYLVEEFKPWPNNGAINKQAIAKTMDLRVRAGKYEPNKVPSYAQFVDFTIVEEAQRQLGPK